MTGEKARGGDLQPTKNTSIVFTGPERIELMAIDSDLLPLGDHEILAQTRYSLISAGTELACLSGIESWFSFPGTPGYASVSEVIAVGREVSAAAPGDIVFSMGGHCQYQRIDAANPRALCVKVPAGMDLSQAVFARMICVSFTALRISTIEVGDYVAVIGLGLVGNFAAQLAGLQGGRVIGLDHNEKRVELARECGVAHAMALNAETVAADIAAITAGSDVTTLIEATGNPRALPMALPLVGRYGEIIMLGVSSRIIMVLFPVSKRTHYGTGTSPSRHNDGGNPPSDTE